MIQWTWGTSLSPGNEQINRWSSKAAGIEGTLNYPGVENAAVDAMIDALLQARKRRTTSWLPCARFDRALLLSGDYVIPLYYLAAGLGGLTGATCASPASSLCRVDVDTWWTERTNSSSPG